MEGKIEKIFNNTKAMRYMIAVDGGMYGYNDPIQLIISISENKPEKYVIYERVNTIMTLAYKEISIEKLRGYRLITNPKKSEPFL